MRRSDGKGVRWVITAENPMTGEREVVSLPMSRAEAIAAVKKEIRENAGKDGRIFRRARIREYEPRQLTLW